MKIKLHMTSREGWKFAVEIEIDCHMGYTEFVEFCRDTFNASYEHHHQIEE